MSYINRISLVVAGLAILLMCILGTADIVAGFVLGSPIPAAYEVTELLMAVSVILAISSLQERRMNIVVETLLERFGANSQARLLVLSNIVGLAFFGLIAWQAWFLAAESLKIREYAQGAYPVPVYPAKVLFAIGAILVVCQYIKDLYDGFFGRVKAVARPPAH